MLTLEQIRKIAQDSIAAGPALHHDADGDIYLAYIMFIRDGMKYTLIVIDKDLADLNGPTVDFMIIEACCFMEASYGPDWRSQCQKSQPTPLPILSTLASLIRTSLAHLLRLFHNSAQTQLR